MLKTVKAGLVAGTAMAAASAGLMVPAQADSGIVQVDRVAHLSPTRVIFRVPVRVVCSEDTTDAALTATVSQVTAGGFQTATGNLTSLGSFECTGDEEVVQVPVRRPLGGFRWVKGPGVTARVSNVVFVTNDPAPGINIDRVRGRTVLVR